MKVPAPIAAPPVPEVAAPPVQSPTRSDVVFEPTLKANAAVAQETVSLEDTTALAASVATGINLAATERAVRLNSLAQEVRSGAYRPNPSQLAERILAEAELEARLAAMVK
jgi:hypothetical protein